VNVYLSRLALLLILFCSVAFLDDTNLLIKWCVYACEISGLYIDAPLTPPPLVPLGHI